MDHVDPALEPPRWVPVRVAAKILGVTSQSVVSYSLKGQIVRKHRMVSHRAVTPQWEYCLEDVMRVKGRRGVVPAHATDTTGVYVSAAHAAQIINCSIQSVYGYKYAGKIHVQPARFLSPRVRTMNGFLLPDVLKLRDDQQTVTAFTHYEEETVQAHQVSIEMRRMPQIISAEAKKTLRKALELLTRDAGYAA
jgi:hypothetical protein